MIATRALVVESRMGCGSIWQSRSWREQPIRRASPRRARSRVALAAGPREQAPALERAAATCADPDAVPAPAAPPSSSRPSDHLAVRRICDWRSRWRRALRDWRPDTPSPSRRVANRTDPTPAPPTSERPLVIGSWPAGSSRPCRSSYRRPSDFDPSARIRDR